MGLIITTRGWSGASIAYTHASGAATYSVSGDAANALDVATALCAWLTGGARPWAGPVTGASFVVGSDGVRHRFALSYSGPSPSWVSVVPNAAWIARFGDPTQSPPTAAPGTLAKDLGTQGWTRRDAKRGVRSRAGGWRMDHQAFAPRAPSVGDRLKSPELYALNEAIALAAQPRTAYLYDPARDEWRLVSLGVVEAEDVEEDPTVVGVTIAVTG